MKKFCIAGPVISERHYSISNRFDWDEISTLIDDMKYFILHAPRQTGKTTGAQEVIDRLNKEGNYKALYVNVESAQAMREDIGKAMHEILTHFHIQMCDTFSPKEKVLELLSEFLSKDTVSASSFHLVLRFLAQTSDKPFVLFIDEIDTLIGDTLISVLRQIRTGYKDRPNNFPQSICLIGVRDVRDYRIWSSEKQWIVVGGSAFNIKAESLRLSDFTQEQVRDLYEQHTKETGQKFADEAIEYAFYLTQGQPWLVNALAYEACFRDVKDRSKPITRDIIEKAKETLILRRDTHLDVLIDRLTEDRVRVIIDAIINGEQDTLDVSTDDIQYCQDLGLLALGKELKIANPIYQEVIPRELSYARQQTITQKIIWYQRSDGSLDMHKLLMAFQQFYRENSKAWIERADYKESAPHIILMAFLQRIINGGGKIHREYALGRKRVDLLVEFPAYAEASADKLHQRIVIELKIRRDEKTIEKSLVQTAEYMDESNATEGHLVVFDRNDDKPWDEKIFDEQRNFDTKKIHVWGV